MPLVEATVIPMSRRRPTKDDRPAWARWLVEQRELRGWLQREFAERLNVSQQSLSGYERGAYRIPEDVAEQIALVLEIPYVEVRARLGMYVPEAELEQIHDREVIRLPAGVHLTSVQRRALQALIDAFVETSSVDQVWVGDDTDIQAAVEHDQHRAVG
jgi:transcriptional regulator with XRE-family HTH domain